MGFLDFMATFNQVGYSEGWPPSKQSQLYFIWTLLISWANKLWMSVSLVPRLPFAKIPS